MARTGGSLRNMFYGEGASFLEPGRFPRISGRGEGRVLTSDGSPVNVGLCKKDATDALGKPIWVMSVHLTWEHENLSLINEAISAALWYFDCDESNRIVNVSWSHEYRRALGYRDALDFPNELSSWSDLLHPEDKDRVMTLLSDVIRDRTSEIKFVAEYRLRTKHAGYQWFRAVAEVARRIDGSVHRIAGILRNIDESKKAQMQAQRSAAFHRAFTDANLCEYYVNLEENTFDIFKVEPSLMTVFERSGAWDELVHHLVNRYVVEGDRQAVTDFYDRTYMAKKLKGLKTELSLECRIILDGEVRWIRNVIMRGEIDDSEYAMIFLRDITEAKEELARQQRVASDNASMDVSQEKKAEIESRHAFKEAYRAAENANRAKTEFLSNMSHDIRTPMNAIIGLTAIAGANIDSQAKVVECLGKITKSSRHLLGLINEVLDMARIESGKITLTEEGFSLPELVDNLLTLTRPGIDAHGHDFEVHVNHIEHEAVCGDSLRIQQVFVNPMSNAIKYTPDGGHITFSIEEKPNGFSELGCYEFTIQDDGIGMTPEFQKVMFEPFSRADDHRTTKVPGTGLGMAITRNIVNLTNGSIEVESAPDQGTKITVTIFLKLQENELGQERELVDLPVLVVDDDCTCCESTTGTLREIGIDGEWVLSGEEAVRRCCARHDAGDDYFAVILDWKMPGADVETAENGKEAVEKVENAPDGYYDLVFMDIQMPLMNGYEATAAIRAMPGERGKLPIVAMTANAFAEDVQLAKNAGMNEHVAKPLDMNKLNDVLGEWLG